MILNTLMGFAFLFLISWLLINPNQNKKVMDAKGEFIITVTWPDKSANDVDTWVEDPQGHVLYFRAKEVGLMHLDRDDLGLDGDKLMDSTGLVTQVYMNREVVTIRGFLPGEYTVNVHLYKQKVDGPTPVTVDIIKVNPFSVIGNKRVILETEKQEITILRFTVKADGTVEGTNTLQKSLARE